MKNSHRVIVAAFVPLAASTACTSTRTIRPAPVTVTARSTVTTTVTATAHSTVTITVAPPAPPVPQPTAAIGEVVDATGTTFSALHSGTVKTYRDQQNQCYNLADRGYTAQCVEVHSKLGTVVGIVELRGTQERDLVYSVRGTRAVPTARRYRMVGTPTEYDGSYYSPATTALASSDLALDNTPKLVFYTPITTATYADAFQSVDVVEASGQLVLHRDLEGGIAARAFGGGIETWAPLGTRVEHEIIQWSAGAWRVTAAAVVSKDDVPGNRSWY